MALLVAATYPELVERCVSIDNLGPFTTSVPSTPKHMRRSIESRRECSECLATRPVPSVAAFPVAHTNRPLEREGSWAPSRALYQTRGPNARVTGSSCLGAS